MAINPENKFSFSIPTRDNWSRYGKQGVHQRSICYHPYIFTTVTCTKPTKANEQIGPSWGQSWDLNPGPSDSKSCTLSTKPWSTWTGHQQRHPLPIQVAAAPDPKLAAQFLLPPLLDHTHWYSTIMTPRFVVKYHNC